MALFVFKNGFESIVEDNIVAIAGPDGLAVGDNQPINQSIIQMTYAPAAGGFAQSRLNAIINSLPVGRPVMIAGVASGTLLPDGLHAGSEEPAFGTEFPGDPGFYIFYDVQQAAGLGHFVCDSAGSATVPAPNFVILFHELAHAFRTITNASNLETDAVADENMLRTQYGLPLRFGHNCSGTGPAGGTPPTTTSCFIVSAASGSAQSPEVKRLVQIRDTLLRGTEMGRRYCEELFREYYQFSPQLATEIAHQPQFKSAIYLFVVRPLVDWFAALEIFGRHDNACSAGAAAAEILSAHWCSESYDEHCLPPSFVISQAIDELRPSEGQAKSLHSSQLAALACFDMTSVFEYLVDFVADKIDHFPYVAWTLIEPLSFYWEQFLVRSSGLLQTGEAFSCFVGEWLARMPLPSDFFALGLAKLETSLSELRTTIFRNERTRSAYGGRLISAAPLDQRSNLEYMLHTIGYYP